MLKKREGRRWESGQRGKEKNIEEQINIDPGVSQKCAPPPAFCVLHMRFFFSLLQVSQFVGREKGGAQHIYIFITYV